MGRCTEKHWGVLFKCLTTRAVHLLPSLSTDSFLWPFGGSLLGEAPQRSYGQIEGPTSVEASGSCEKHMPPLLLICSVNPPSAPHFGGVWEREVRSVKSALYTVLGSQSVPEAVLMTVLLEVEAILNSKPLGYVSSDVADADPVTPSSLLMGRPDGSLPQVIYKS